MSLSLEKRKLRGGDLIDVYKFLKRDGKQMDEARLFLVVHSGRTRSSGLELEHKNFCTNMQENSFMLRVTEQWKRLSREWSPLLWRYSVPTWTPPVRPIVGNQL